MTPTNILAIYIALASLDLVWGLFLTWLNWKNVKRNEAALPLAFAGIVSPEQHAKASAYSLAKMGLTFVQTPIMTALVVAAAASGLLGTAEGWFAALGWPAFWQGVAYLGAVMLASGLLGLPFSLYATFGLEKRFGFNTSTLGTWLVDGLKGLGIGAALGLLLVWMVFSLMDAAGSLWWLWAAGLFSLVNLLMSIVWPLFIAPLFNRFQPLPEGSLKARIEELAARLGFRAGGIFVMDGSKRSRHSNAYFTGFGGAKRIVLYDTLLSSMSEDEVLAVLAHEIGHEKKRHVVAMSVVSIAFAFLAFWCLSLLGGWTELYRAFSFSAPSKWAILLIFSLGSGPATFFLTPLFSAWSRRHEYQADAYAAAATGSAAMRSALLVLNRENASNLSPHPLYSAWYYSHPSLAERLAAIPERDA